MSGHRDPSKRDVTNNYHFRCGSMLQPDGQDVGYTSRLFVFERLPVSEVGW